MRTKQTLRGIAFLSVLSVQSFAVGARYFLALEGLADPNDEQSAATAPNIISDPDPTGVGSAPVRWYLWADLSPSSTAPLTDLKGIDLAFSTTGNMSIIETNIWQRTLDDGGTPDDTSDDLNRWASAPGRQTWDNSFVDLAPAVAVLEPGLTTRTATTSLDNQDRAGGLWLFGWITTTGNAGEIQILNNASGFLQGTGPTNTIYLGLDDNVGGPAEIPGQSVSYSNASPEGARTPEPASLMLMSIAALAIRRR